jgi:hypothetical protein
MNLFAKLKKIFFASKSGNGFAMLFAVLLSSVLISIGLSIFNISIKELSIATAEKDSIQAYYSADSARECFIFWDIVRGAFPACLDNNCSNPGDVSTGVVGDQTVNGVSCASTSIPMKFTYDDSNKAFDYSSTTFFKFPGWPVAPDSGITASKTFINGSPTVIQTIISANGHNTGIIGRRVERGMSFTYSQ